MFYRKIVLFFSFLFYVAILTAQTPSFRFEEKRAEKGDTVQVCVFVEDFTDVVSAQYTITWDKQILKYLYSGDYALPGLSEFSFAEHLADQGLLPFVWFDNAVLGVTLPDSSQIFCLYFETLGDIGDTSAVNFSGTPTPFQIGVLIDGRIREIQANYTNGKVEIVTNILEIQDSITHNLCWGDSKGSIQVQADGGITPYVYNWSGPDGFIAQGAQLRNLPAGNYTLVLTDSLGRQNEKTYEITEPSVPLLIEQFEIQPSDCGQSNGAISLRAGGGTAPYSYDFGTGFSSDSLLLNLPPGAYDMVIADNNECQLDTILIVPMGNAPLLDLGPDIALCAAETVMLNTTGGLATYQWFRNDVLLAEAGNELAVSEGGTYRLVVETPEGCALADTVIVRTLADQISLGEDVALCSMQTTLLSAAAGIGTYQWFQNDTPLAETGHELVVSEAGTYRLAVETPEGCGLADTVEVSSVTTTINLGEDISLCSTETATLSVAAQLGDYQWFQNDIPLSETNNELTVSQAGNYRLEVTTREKCKITDDVFVRSISEAVFLGPDITICEGETTQLTVTPALGDYQWFRDGVRLDEIGSSLEIGAQGKYRLDVQTAEGCLISDEVEIELLEVGMVDLGGDITICPNETVLISADGMTGDYQWFRNNGSLPQMEDEININNDGTYRVEVTTPEGCKASDELTVRFSSIAAFASGDGSMVAGDSTQLLAVDGVSYQWAPTKTLSCDQCADPIARPEENTTYVAIIITADGCEIKDSVFIEVLPVDEKLRVVPVTFISPNGDGENDALFFPGLENYTSNTLTIFSRWGQILYSKSDYQLHGELWDATLRGQPLPAGIYYYVLRVNEREITIKKTLTVVRE